MISWLITWNGERSNNTPMGLMPKGAYVCAGLHQVSLAWPGWGENCFLVERLEQNNGKDQRSGKESTAVQTEQVDTGWKIVPKKVYFDYRRTPIDNGGCGVAEATGARKDIVEQDFRNSEGTGAGSTVGSRIYDCICKILLKWIEKKLCDSRWKGKTKEFPGMLKDLWVVWMRSVSFGLLCRKLWSWWPLSAPKISECVISEIAFKISLKRLYLPFVSFILNWRDSPLERSFFFSVLYSDFFQFFISALLL